MLFYKLKYMCLIYSCIYRIENSQQFHHARLHAVVYAVLQYLVRVSVSTFCATRLDTKDMQGSNMAITT